MPDFSAESPISSGASTPKFDPLEDGYIEAQETAGLPSPDAFDHRRRADQYASRLVRAHTAKSFSLAAWKRPKKKKRRSGGGGDSQRLLFDADEEAGPGSGRYEERSANNPPMGGGVLSALLSLYDQHRNAEEHDYDPMDTPSSSRSLSPPPRPRTSGLRPLYTQPSASVGSTVSLQSIRELKTNVSGILGRPKQARNAGGVFGALIASTGNLSSAAAPGPSTLAPDITRPGYNLSRYSLDQSEPAPRAGAVRHSRLAASEYSIDSMETSPQTTPRGGSSMHLQMASDETRVNSDSGHHDRHSRESTGVGMPRTETWDSDWKSEVGGKRMSYASGYDDEKRGGGATKRKPKKAEIFITRHIADVIQRQEFILKLIRAFMMFGAPTHRLQSQLHSTARVLDLSISCMYLPDTMLISFQDASTSTSSLKFIRQASALNLGKLQDAYDLYWDVIHDKIGVGEAAKSFDILMKEKPRYGGWKMVLIGGFCSAWICTVAFAGSFVDSLAAFPLGCILMWVQLRSNRNELYANIFEITIATLLSFLAAALASTHHICYPSVASSSIVLILPGVIILSGSLELSSRNIVSGSVRLWFGVMYALFLGFGLAIGATIFEWISRSMVVGGMDYYCKMSHDPNGPWWQRTASTFWAFLTVPMYAFFLSLRFQAPWKTKEMLVTIVIACMGWMCNHFAAKAFPNRNDASCAIGAFVVGFIANVYGRFFSGNAFVIMITGILFQIPVSLGSTGLITFVSQQINNSTTSYLSGFQTALQIISVGLGLTVGLAISLVVVHPIPSRKRAGGIFSL
ncbi:DUF1212-domain-containing protein [Rickenella mellea]|uniref:DUF1212-domain-containing protein n=1 Tax=Rickenella mellea TaxID=50990 RepID=A0A4Y7PPW0_9AGAM|nr:DUF1212-domain-containing protein [Rickenella mellea]